MTNDDTLSEYEIKLLQNVDVHGLQVTHVFDPDGVEEAFSYSIGLPVSVGQPDIIVFGLQNDLMHFMINEVAKQCRDGLILSDGCIVDGLIGGHSCVARQVLSEHITAANFSSAMWLFRRIFGKPMDEAFQIVWPGKDQGLFPWEKGCDADVIAAQPALYQKENEL